MMGTIAPYSKKGCLLMMRFRQATELMVLTPERKRALTMETLLRFVNARPTPKSQAPVNNPDDRGSRTDQQGCALRPVISCHDEHVHREKAKAVASSVPNSGRGGAMGFDWAIRRSFSLGECKIEY